MSTLALALLTLLSVASPAAVPFTAALLAPQPAPQPAPFVPYYCPMQGGLFAPCAHLRYPDVSI